MGELRVMQRGRGPAVAAGGKLEAEDWRDMAIDEAGGGKPLSLSWPRCRDEGWDGRSLIYSDGGCLTSAMTASAATRVYPQVAAKGNFTARRRACLPSFYFVGHMTKGIFLSMSTLHSYSGAIFDYC